MKTVYSMILVIAIVLAASTAFADILVTQVTSTEAMEMMGRKMPARSDTAQIWFGENSTFLASGESTTLIRYDLGKMFVIMPHKQSYSEIPLSIFEVLDSIAPEQPMVTGEVTVTDETKKIKDWDCSKYLVKMKMKMGMAVEQEMWVTKDIDVDIIGMLKAVSGMMAGFTGFAEMMKEFEKIKGFPVHSTMKMSIMGNTMTSITEVISVVERSAPEGLYEIPKGYTKVDPSAISPH